MRILLVMAEAAGGVAGHVSTLARDLARTHQVAIATTPGTAARLRAGDQLPGVRVLETLPLGNRRSRSAMAAWQGFRAAVRGADVVHAHGHQAGTISVLAAASVRPRPPVIITWHNALLVGGAAGLAGRALEEVQVRGADLITGASSDLVRRARQLGAERALLSEVAPAKLSAWAGDPVEAKRDLADAHDLPVDRPWVLTVSRIAPQKNLPILLDAAARLNAAAAAGEVPAAQFVVVGDGDPALQEQLLARIERERLPVRLVGASRRVPEFIAASTVLALPSQWEARSFVVQEALAGGLPCVVTDTGGLPDLVAGVGLLVPVGESGALAGEIGLLLADPDLTARFAVLSRTRAAELPTTDHVHDEWERRYREITMERSAA